MFDPTSRYAKLATLAWSQPDGSTASYVVARILPQTNTLTVLGLATPGEGERLDLFSARTLGDPLLFWRIADANGVMDPADVPGLAGPLVVPLPTV